MRHGSTWPDSKTSAAAASAVPKHLCRKAAWGSIALAAALFAASPAQARVTKIVIDTKVSPAFSGVDYPAGSGRVYETLAGRVFGELDPTDSHNTIIQDLQLAPRNAAGKVEYSATFFLVKPIDIDVFTQTVQRLLGIRQQTTDERRRN